MLALSLAPEFSLHIQVTVSHSLLRCKQADKNQDYSTDTLFNHFLTDLTDRKLGGEVFIKPISQ